MKLIDLAMPLYEGMPAGYGHKALKGHHLWPEVFKMEKVQTYEQGLEMFVYTVFCQAGTRVVLPSNRPELYKLDPTRLDTIELDSLILKDAVIIDTPKGAGEIVELAEFEAALNKAPIQEGDALLLRTGWGDKESYLKLGHLYIENSPHYSQAAADKLMEFLEKNSSNVWLYDVHLMGGLDKRTGAFGGFANRAGLIPVGGLVNCGAITKPRVKVIILPMYVKNAHMAPCRVVAIEE